MLVCVSKIRTCKNILCTHKINQRSHNITNIYLILYILDLRNIYARTQCKLAYISICDSLNLSQTFSLILIQPLYSCTWLYYLLNQIVYFQISKNLHISNLNLWWYSKYIHKNYPYVQLNITQPIFILHSLALSSPYLW